MTSNKIQYRVRLDPNLDKAIRNMMANSSRIAERDGHKKLTFNALITGEIIKLQRRNKLEAILKLGEPYPAIYSPPTDRNNEAPRPSIYIDDAPTNQEILRIAELAARPPAHIIYSLMRYITSKDVKKRSKTAPALIRS